MNAFLSAVRQFIATNDLLDRSRLHLVALSGGADSTALLLVMKELGYQVEAMHCNFRLRGEESNRDEAFCRQLCEQKAIPFHVTHFDTREYAALHHISIEMAARRLRYSWFAQLRRDLHADSILVAHHQEDQTETVLINLLRGTGLHGLRGILPRNGHVVRPLLDVSRQQIEDYLAGCHQDFVTDSTNLVDDVVRNKLRLDVIPLLKTINPAVISNINTTARHLTEASRIVDDSLEKFLKNRKEIVCYLPNPDVSVRPDEEPLPTSAEINIEALRKYSSPEYALYYILQKYDFTGVQAEQIHDALLHPVTGKLWTSATHQLIIDRENILIQRIVSRSDREFRIPETGKYRYDSDHVFRLSQVAAEGFVINRSREVASLDAEKVKFPLTVRPVQQGDRFAPLGMKGTKLVSDYLTDRKKNLFKKQRQLVVVDGAGNIVWMVNDRPSEKCRISSSTEHVLVIELVME